jgi:hypothetical protein
MAIVEERIIFLFKVLIRIGRELLFVFLPAEPFRLSDHGWRVGIPRVQPLRCFGFQGSDLRAALRFFIQVGGIEPATESRGNGQVARGPVIHNVAYFDYNSIES